MRTDRRNFLGATFGATAAVASGANGLMTVAQAGPVDGKSLDPHVSRDPAVRAAAADDFGRLIHRQPRAVLKASSSADVAALMRWASREGVKVAARGLGHSIYGRALVDDGIVIDMSAAQHDTRCAAGSHRGRCRNDMGQRARGGAGARADAAGADQLSGAVGGRHDLGRRHRRIVVPLRHANRSGRRAGRGDGRWQAN